MKELLDILTAYGPGARDIVSLLVIVYLLIKLILDWFGSPELRIIKDQLQEQNANIRELIQLL